MTFNIVGNAVKFTVRGKITITIKRVYSVITIIVTGTGIGMSPETQNHLFEPFMQADSSTTRQYGGTGLGFSICKSLVNLLNGSIKIKSELGHGSIFEVTLPLQKVQATTDTSQVDLHLSAPHKLCDANLLVAEDNMINQTFIKKVLEKFGLKTVTIVRDGQKALEEFLAHHNDYDVILMDCMMPVLDGYGSTMAIRKFEKENDIKRIPIIALTASTLRENIDRCLQSGMDAHIAKPFNHAELFGIVKR